MATIRTEQKEMAGKLHTAFGVFDMLEPEGKRIGFSIALRELGAISFLVRDGFGYAKVIIVKGDFMIEPAIKSTVREVHYMIEEEVPEPTPT